MHFTIKIRSKIIIKAYQPYFSRNGKVLDIGCGNGVMAHEIGDYFNCHITGTDIVNYLETELPYKAMENHESLPFSSNAFDGAMFNDVLHHIPLGSQVALIQEALRVARNNVLIFEMQPTFIAKLIDRLINKIHNPNMPVPLALRSDNEWSCLLKDAGFHYEFETVKKPLYYPIHHFIFILKKA